MNNKKEIVKRNISSMQVLKTLQLLLEDNYTMTELIEKMNKTEKEPIFNNSVISKYINTCRYCGFEIHKIHNKYFLASMPFGIDLTDIEADLLEKMQKTGIKILSNKMNRTLNKALSKISKFSNKEIIRVEKKTVELTQDLFEKAIRDGRYIRLMFKIKSEMDCIPIGITEIKGRLYFEVNYEGKNRTICVQRVSGLKILNEKFRKQDFDESLIFKIKGDLISRYDLRENENIISQKLPEYIVISNIGEEKTSLLSRLMRYDTLCEVETKSYRESIKKMIDDTLANYGE